MVAYSFAPPFRDQVASLQKRQTVRGERRRHARPGEPVQLFAAMRTKWCCKLVDPDPMCIDIVPIAITTTRLVDSFLASIEIAGRALDRDEIETFAAADGFAPIDFGWLRRSRRYADQPATSRSNMGEWWIAKHGLGRFEGWLIRWEPGE